MTTHEERLPCGSAYVSITELALVLGIPDRTARSLVESGKVEHRSFGRGWPRLIPVSEVRRLERQGFPADWLRLDEHRDGTCGTPGTHGSTPGAKRLP